MSTARLHIYVSGRVQGVCYRAYTQRKARELGVSGWVRNLPDGRVEMEAQGDRRDLAELVRWCRSGPPAARVEKVEVTEIPPLQGEQGFSITY